MEEDTLGMKEQITDEDEGYGDFSTEVGEFGANINDLPVEMLIQIFSHLDPVQLSELRLVCKRWRAVIQGREVWINSFGQKFGTRKQFASLMYTKYWITEYFMRSKLFKQWKKNTVTRKFFQVVTGSFCYIDKCLVDFNQNKLLVYSSPLGDITSYTLSTGKSQTYIPSSSLTISPCAYDVNWGYHLFAKSSGELYMRNLFTATSSTGRSSVVELRGPSSSWVTSCKLNPQCGKQREIFDCISATTTGSVEIWKSNGLIKHLELKKYILNVESDFRRFVIANSKSSIFIISYADLSFVEVDLNIPYDEVSVMSIDVDYGDCNIVICHGQHIRVFNYTDLNNIKVKQFDLEYGVTIERTRIQTGRDSLLHTKDKNVVGGDGLLYACILSDSSVVVWDVRDPEKDIKPYFRVSATFKSQKFQVPEDMLEITDVALNSSVLIVSGYNGYANLYNSCTGKLLGECSVKLPQKFNVHNNLSLIPTTNITLNPDQSQTNGLIGFGNILQYFRFGEIEKPSYSSTKKKGVLGSSNKYAKWQTIRDGMEEYDINQQRESEQRALVQEYNGSLNDLDDELQLTLALSQSDVLRHQPSSNDEDKELELAIKLSMQTPEEHDAPEADNIDETEEEKQLREAIRLSLLEI